MEWRKVEPLAITTVQAELRRMGRSHDRALADVMIAECAYRVVKLSGRLIEMGLAGPELRAYLRKVFQGAARDAVDDPTCGPTRKNARRQQTPTEPLGRLSWPDDPFSDGESPTWTHDRDGGSGWQFLVDWAAATARAIATANELVAVNQVLDGASDRETCGKAGMGKSAWANHRVKLLTGLAPKLVAVADDRVDWLGEKYLGKLWTDAGKRVEAHVLYEKGRIAA